jgi:hypothetical protein
MNEFFDNKTIAIVGNAKSLFSKLYGKEIDEHDIVLRINRGLEVCLNTKDIKTHGNKVDVWCFNLYKTLAPFDIKMKTVLPQTYKRIQMNYTPILGKFDSTISDETFKEIQNLFTPKKVTTGFRVLHYISKYETKLVNVYGFDWKETPTYYMRHNSTTDLSHDYIKEKEYCYKTYFETRKYNLNK